jgi:hypothetical protein
MADYLDYSRILEATDPSGIVDGLFSGHGNGRFLGSWSIGTSPVEEVGGGDPGPAEGGAGVAGHLPHRRGRRALLRRRRAKLNSPEDATAHRARDAEAAFAAARAGPPAALLDSQAVGDDMADYLDYSRILEATEPSGIVDGLFSGHGNGRFLGSGFEMGSVAAGADEGWWGRARAGATEHIHAHQRWAAPLLVSVLLSPLLISASLSFSSSRALLISFSPLPSAASAEPLFVEAPRGAPCPGWCGGRCCAVVVGGAFHRAWEGTRLWASARSAGGEIRGGCEGHPGVRRFRAGLACGRLWVGRGQSTDES